MTDAVDGFAGCGGAGMGLGLLGLSEVGLEWAEPECRTRQAAGLATVRTDVAAYPTAPFTGVEGMWHSPPCPSFSTAGKGAGLTITDLIEAGMHRVMDGKGWDDLTIRATGVIASGLTEADPEAASARAKAQAEMSMLVLQPLRWARDLRPRWLACEQVPTVEPIWQMMAHHLQALGYRTWVGCLSAERYGVPQTRNRAYLMAHLDRPVGPPAPTHQQYRSGRPAEASWDLVTGEIRPWVSMAEALGWGMTERPGMTFAPGTAAGGMDPVGGSGARAVVADHQARGAWQVDTRRDQRPDGSTQVRPGDEPAPCVTPQSGTQWLLQPGASPDGRGGNRRIYSGDEPSPTLHFGHDAAAWCWRRPATTVAGDPRITAPYHHYDGEQGARPTSSADVRDGGDPGRGPIRLEPWEALVLQSFPSDYPVAGTRTAQFRQIGNACSPFVVAAIVGELLGLDWQAAVDAVTGGR